MEQHRRAVPLWSQRQPSYRARVRAPLRDAWSRRRSRWVSGRSNAAAGVSHGNAQRTSRRRRRVLLVDQTESWVLPRTGARVSPVLGRSLRFGLGVVLGSDFVIGSGQPPMIRLTRRHDPVDREHPALPIRCKDLRFSVPLPTKRHASTSKAETSGRVAFLLLDQSDRQLRIVSERPAPS